MDSEPNYDFLRVYVDGVERFAKSGQEAGRATVDVGGGGNHRITLEYYKDTSVDVGRDLGLVYSLAASSGGLPVESWDFAGQPLGAEPDGWTASGADGGWLVSDPPPPRAYLTRGGLATEPSLDGRLAASEYPDSTVLPLFDVGSADGELGTAWLRESDSSEALFIGLRVHSATVPLGGESGTLTLLLDARRLDTLSTVGCGVAGTMPATDDRKIVITYSSSTGQPGTPTVQQFTGICQAWMPLSQGSNDEWPVAVAVSEPTDDPGFVHIEMKLDLKPRGAASSAVLAEGKLGLGLMHQNTAARLSRENLPAVPGDQLADDDVATWLTLDLAAQPTNNPMQDEIRAFPSANPRYLGRVRW